MNSVQVFVITIIFVVFPDPKMSTILEPQSENFKRTVLCGYFKAGLSPEASVEFLAADFPAITTQEVSAWFARFRTGNFEVGENVSINAEGIVVDRSVRLKQELDDAEQADGEPPARMNPNPPVVPKREVDEEDGANHNHQVNGAANHVVARQEPVPHDVAIVAANENPPNGNPQVVPKIEIEDGEDADHARANPVNEANRAPAINRNQRAARVRQAQRAVAIPPQNPVHPIQPGMHPVNLANLFPPAPLPFQIAPQFLPDFQFNQFGFQFPLQFGPYQNPPYIEAAYGLPIWNQAGNIGQLQNFNVGFGMQNWQIPQYQELAAQQHQVAENLRFQHVKISLGKDTAALLQQQMDRKSETLFIQRNEGCTIKDGPRQLESNNHYIDCAINALKRVVDNNGVEIKHLEIVCQDHVTISEDIVKFFHDVTDIFERAPRHIEEFELLNCTRYNNFDWISIIKKILSGLIIGPLVALEFRTRGNDVPLEIGELQPLMPHLQHITNLQFVNFLLPISINTLIHIPRITMSVEALPSETILDYRNVGI
ncbi:hypothetical protein B9Z55_023487 [Caenorhabditis nigoni]|uniref:Uncharacterized protein n=2 Tax=Caenorhabditis nigoni TaxID=1611254 RepID=A0A2G5SQN0_9PELO|nr:hypothetical protein B9Z55_023487 [Caenorhabditis nigoni]